MTRCELWAVERGAWARPPPGRQTDARARSLPFLPQPPADDDLLSPGRRIAVVSTAAPPWLTGTAVNPALRAAFLAAARSAPAVTLVVPWLPAADQAELFPNGTTFAAPSDQEAALRAWVESRTGTPPMFAVSFYPARYDRTLLGDLTSLRFLDAGQSAIILGPVGVGKTHLATALGHMAIRRRNTVLFSRADKLFTRLRAARLDSTVDAEFRRLAAIDVLIIDDFALRPLGATETSDFYEIVVERHRNKTTIVTSNREPAEWLTMTADTLLTQSAIDRLTAAAHTLVVEGPSHRQRSRTGALDPDRPDEHPR